MNETVQKALERMQRTTETDAQWEQRIGMTRDEHYADMDPFKRFRSPVSNTWTTDEFGREIHV